MGISRVNNPNLSKISRRKPDGTVAATMMFSNSSEKKRKKLQYNFKRISNQIMGAKTSGTARRVLVSARSATAVLLRKQRTGDYDETELRHAIIHAQKMERIAKKRMKHLQEEENAQKRGGPCEAEMEEEDTEYSLEEFEEMSGQDAPEMSSEEMKRLMQELMQELQELMEEAEAETGLEDLSMELMSANMDPEDLELMKKKHRAQEMREIMEADMKYLKAMFDKLERDKQETSQAISQAIAQSAPQTVSNGVSLELAGAEVPIPAMNASAAEVVAMGEGANIDITV